MGVFLFRVLVVFGGMGRRVEKVSTSIARLYACFSLHYQRFPY